MRDLAGQILRCDDAALDQFKVVNHVPAAKDHGFVAQTRGADVIAQHLRQANEGRGIGSDIQLLVVELQAVCCAALSFVAATQLASMEQQPISPLLKTWKCLWIRIASPVVGEM